MQEDKTEEETEVASYYSGPSAWNNFYIDKYLYSLLFWDYLYHAALLYSYILSWLHCIIMYSIQADVSGFMNKSPNITNAIMGQCTNILIHWWINAPMQKHKCTNVFMNQYIIEPVL